MTESIRRNYDGYSEACLDCKRFYDGNAPCKTCEYRMREEERLPGVIR